MGKFKPENQAIYDDWKSAISQTIYEKKISALSGKRSKVAKRHLLSLLTRERVIPKRNADGTVFLTKEGLIKPVAANPDELRTFNQWVSLSQEITKVLDNEGVYKVRFDI